VPSLWRPASPGAALSPVSSPQGLQVEQGETVIELKADDRPETDPHEAAVELLATLRSLLEDATYQVAVLSRWSEDPIRSHRKAQGIAIDIAASATLALESAEQLSRAYGARGLYSFEYGREVT
jgi:hypothetical protein